MTLKEALELLEVDESMDSAEIKRAYSDLLSVWHPDKNLHNKRLSAKAEEKTKEINNAYDVIKKSITFKSKKTSPSEGKKKQQQDQQDKYESKNDNLHTIVSCINCGIKNRIPRNRAKDPRIKCGRCKDSLHIKSEKAQKHQQQDQQDKYDAQSDKEDSHAYACCVNCGFTNRIPKNISGQASARCGGCGNSPFVKYRKPDTNRQSTSESISFISVRCINCATDNQIPKSKSYNPSAMCAICGKSIYLKDLSGQRTNTGHKKVFNDLDKKIDDIYKKHFGDLGNLHRKNK